MPRPIRALTLIQPWGWAVFHGKPVENRRWLCPAWQLGQPLAIHGGKKYDREAEEFLCKLLGLHALPAEAHAQGLLGIVVPDRNVSEDGDFFDALMLSPYYFGPCGWALRDQVEFREPVPCKGAQGLWIVPPDLLPTMRERFAAAKGAR
jgi:hypothetical protein